jgi:hypothetical protein
MDWRDVWLNFYIIITGASSLVGALFSVLVARTLAIYLMEFISTQLQNSLKDSENVENL